MHLFKAVVMVSQGLSCDCCVDVSRVNADVYARDEAHAQELIKKFDPYSQVDGKLEDKGNAEKVENPGVIVVNVSSVYRGVYDRSPLYLKTTSKAQ